jgi:beta-glucosidase
MSPSNFAHRFRLAALVWVAWLASGVLSSCTPQPTNLARDGAGMGSTPFGPAQPGAPSTVGVSTPGGSTAGSAGTGGTNESGPNISGGVNGPTTMVVGGPPVGDDDPTCSSGYPPQEDPSFRRASTIREGNTDATSMFGQLQLSEKQTLLSGYENYDYGNGTAFEAAPLPRVNYPTFRMRDGPRGVRGVVSEKSTTFPVAEVRAASFDVELEERVGKVFAEEMRALRVDLLLAPTINVLRHPGWARAQETYGEDPVLIGEIGAAFVRGLQAGPQGMPACVKHYAGNNTDENRGGNNQRGVNAIIDEQNLRENYTRAFQIIVEKADPACIMAAYNDVNGSPSTENAHLLTDILRKAPSDPQRGFGWLGFVVSDWGATLGAGHGQLALNAGLDLEMPNPAAFAELGNANAAGIDRAAQRILNARSTFGQLSASYLQLHGQPQDGNIVNNEQHRALTREVEEKGAVLLKNNGVLPLGKSIGDLGTPALQSIVFLGPDANIPRAAAVDGPHGLGDGGSSQTFPPYIISFLQGVTERGTGVTITQSANAADAAGKTVAIIPVTMAHADEGEAYGGGGDRDTLTISTVEPRHWTGQKPTAFINAVRAANPNVKIVVLLAVGSAVVMEDWIDSADAIVQTFYSGQEGGHAVAGLLFGDINFSGKLPFTIATDPSHYPVFGNTAQSVQFEYLHGYRRLEANNNAPRFWFGHGLSYTSYQYGEPSVLCSAVGPKGRLNVQVMVTNSGTVAGDEVVQLYVRSPATQGLLHEPPPKELKAFARVALAAGETKAVQLFVPARDLRHWGPNGWELASGAHTVYVGPSADPAKLKSTTFMVSN